MSRASEDRLSALHGMIADGVIEELDRALARARLNPDDPDAAVSPQLLDKAMKFLSITGVTAPLAVKKAEDVQARLRALTETDLDLDAARFDGPSH